MWRTGLLFIPGQNEIGEQHEESEVLEYLATMKLQHTEAVSGAPEILVTRKHAHAFNSISANPSCKKLLCA